jgi:hypothetical protein
MPPAARQSAAGTRVIINGLGGLVKKSNSGRNESRLESLSPAPNGTVSFLRGEKFEEGR